MKKILASLLAAQILSGVTATASLAYDNPAREQALGMMRHRDYDGALNKLNEAIGFNATDPENYMLRGKCFFVMHNYQLAIEDFNHVIQYSPNYSRAFLWRGTAHSRLGADDLAIKDFAQAIRLRPELARAYFANPGASGLPGHKAGAGGPAVQDYKTAMAQVYPNGFDASAAPRLGSADSASMPNDGNDEFGDTVDASGDRAPQTASGPSGILARSSGDPVANGAPLERVRIRRDGRAGGADEGVYRALAENPAATDLNTTMAGNTDVGRSDDSLPEAGNRRVTNRFDTDPNYGQFGPVPGSQPLSGDPEKMIKETTEALRLDQTNPDLYFKRAKAYQALAQPNKAYADYSEAIRLFPKAMYYVGRASLFYQLNKPMLVDADVRSAIATDPTTPRTIHFGGEKFPANVRWGGDGPDGN